jgi:hypothetical protein
MKRKNVTEKNIKGSVFGHKRDLMRMQIIVERIAIFASDNSGGRIFQLL